MCDPVTLALTAASTTVSLMGQYGAQQANNAIAKANIANLQIAAEDARQRGGKEAGAKRIQGRQTMGTQRAIQGASGVRVDSGSAMDVVTSTAGMFEADALTIIENAEREAMGYMSQAANVKAQNELSKQATKFGMVGTVLGAGSNLWGKSDYASNYATRRSVDRELGTMMDNNPDLW